jgi:hypothetical protein
MRMHGREDRFSLGLPLQRLKREDVEREKITLDG